MSGLQWFWLVLTVCCIMWGLNMGGKSWHRHQAPDRRVLPKRLPGTVYFMDRTIDDDHPLPIKVGDHPLHGYRLLYSYAAPNITAEMKAVREVLQPYKVRGGYHYDATRMIIDKLREGDLA